MIDLVKSNLLLALDANEKIFYGINSGYHIECGDDAIVLKNTGDYKQYGACENIVISNCTLISTSAAIKFGTEG